MQDEEIDKLINDAASQHHPPYDDKAWGKMEELLDQHLPVKKDRRRYVYFILLALLLGSAVGVAIIQPWKNNSTIDAAQDANTPGAIAKANPANSSNANNAAEPVSNNTNNTATPITGQQNSTAITAGVTDKGTAASTTLQQGKANDDQQLVTKKKTSYTKKGKTAVRIKSPGADYLDEQSITAEQNVITKDKDNTNLIESAADVANKQASTTDAEQKNAEIKVDDAAGKPKPAVQATETVTNKPGSAKDKKKTGKSFASNFALTFSTGTDLSYVDISNAGKMQVFYGAGITYTLGKHFRIGSGFYTSKKIYSARPYEYKFPGGASYPNLQSINADCKVYEIPVSLYYSFAAAKKHNWFAGMGISSLLMKKETYDYLYKTPSGQAYSYAKTINNENKHYFSVLTLSGGYQYNLNGRLSLIAEPYLKLPLSGVGAGKIKLNSTGLAFTAVIKPFGKAKK